MFAFNRAAAVKVAAIVFVLLAAFSAWSFSEFGQPLPDYYLPKRLRGSRFGQALFGHLFSPSRGLFVFMPFLLLPLLFWRQSVKVVRDDKRVLILLAWPALHLVSVSSFPHWWGGYSYGPRLMLDIVPALFLLYCLFVKDLRWRSWVLRSVVLTGLLAIYIHTVQGVFNIYAYQWNVQPGVDEKPQTIWDWRYPQFLHTESRHNRRERELIGELAPVSSGETLALDSEKLGFVGWRNAWPEQRWSRGELSEIHFRIGEGDTWRGELRLRATFQGQQRVTVSLNGSKVALLEGADRKPGKWLVVFDPGLLNPGGANRVEFKYGEVDKAAPVARLRWAMALERISLR